MSRLRAPTPPSRLRLGRHDAPQLPYYLIQTVTHRRVAQSHARSHLLERAAANHEIHNETLLLIRQTGQRRKRIIPLDLRVARMAVHRPHAQHTAACGTRLWQPFLLHTHIDYIFSPAALPAAADNGPHRYCGTRPPCPAPYARRRPRRRERPQHDARRYEKPDDMQTMLRHASLREATAHSASQK